MCISSLTSALSITELAKWAAGVVVGTQVLKMLYRQLSKTTKKLPEGVVEVPWMQGFTRFPIVGHMPTLFLRYSQDHIAYGCGRMCGMGANEDGISKMEAAGITAVYVSDPEMIKELFSRNYQVGDVIGKPSNTRKGYPEDPLLGNGLFTADDADEYARRLFSVFASNPGTFAGGGASLTGSSSSPSRGRA